MPNSQLDTFQGGNGLERFEDDEEEDEEVEAELEALFALAQVDAEVAVAYEIVAQDVDEPTVRDRLLEFAQEHHRHVDEIGAYLKAQGVEPAAAIPDPETSGVATLANALSAMSPDAGMRSLSASEYFSNAAYAALLEVVGDSPARALIERSMADEHRHARWLAEHPDIESAVAEARPQ
ncbi:MAG TPA: ferritin-like domain-containing protein [Polyangiaceae bacterium]|jgi:ferritin-like metal-binding protein YciE|nr:ferritin-like domain-containing protein [Polyangiaceae bacterium]